MTDIFYVYGVFDVVCYVADVGVAVIVVMHASVDIVHVGVVVCVIVGVVNGDIVCVGVVVDDVVGVLYWCCH